MKERKEESDSIKEPDSIKDRINDKIREIEENLQDLLEIVPASLKEYESDFKTKAACERYFEKIIESIIVIAFQIIKAEKFRIPREDTEAFELLSKEGILSPDLAKTLGDAKGMRNILAHKYGETDNSKVFCALSEELEEDVRNFLAQIEKYLKNRSNSKSS